VVPSPRPRRILELDVIGLLVDAGIVVICAGGGGIPVVRDGQGRLAGVEAVIDKDLAGALLARELGADLFLMLTDVDAVYLDWGTPKARPIRSASPEALRERVFAEGSMAPKVEAACEFAERTGGRAGIGRLDQAGSLLKGTAGTLISSDCHGIQCRP
jgi:carbamate kinase